MRYSPHLHGCLLLSVLVLGGCATASADRFPSLARREAERFAGSAQPVAPDPRPTIVPAATGSRLTLLRQRAGEAHREFEQRRAGAASLTRAAQGSAVATEAWAVAQVALADLESSRSEAMIALADLDALYVAAAEAAAATGGSAELDAVAAVRDEVSGWIGAEDSVLNGLRSQLRT